MPIVTEIYSREDIENKDKKIQELERDVGNLKFQVSEYQQIVEELSEKLSVLMVPFSIPPMLARWDRALKDLHQIENIEVLNPLFVEEDVEDKDSSSEEA